MPSQFNFFTDGLEEGSIQVPHGGHLTGTRKMHRNGEDLQHISLARPCQRAGAEVLKSNSRGLQRRSKDSQAYLKS